MVKDEKSIISYILFDTTDNWSTVFNICAGFLTDNAKNRLQTITVSSIIVEKQYIDKDYRNTFSKFHSKKFVTPDSRCIRLHLFTSSIDFENPDTKKWQNGYAGYIILRPTLPNSIGRTLLSPSIFKIKGSYLCVCIEKIMVNGVELEIQGFPFISQDTDATVCAQSSLWMLLRYFSNRYRWYKEVYPSDLSSIVKAHPHGRTMPGAGLTMIQMADVLRELGFSSLLYNNSEYGNDFFKYAYNYIESGFPLLLGLPEHVLVAVGHISDFSDKGMESTFDYFKGFIVNDDNGTPYDKLTRNSTENFFKYDLNQVDSFLVPLPDKVFLSAEQVKAITERLCTFFKNQGYKVPELRRIFLTTGRSFKKSALGRYSQIPEVQNFYLKIPLPHFIWVCELSEHDLYSKSFKCSGEIIWDATRNTFECQLGLVVHLPGILIFDTGAAYNTNPNYQLINGLKEIDYNIYKNNLKEIL
jgi:hypothetical protein